MQIPVPMTMQTCSPATRSQLEFFIQQPEPSAAGPCPGCSQHIPVQCSPSCSGAAQALSIDPERYPIEAKVIPLVFELMATRLLQTCWSCEGHMDHQQQLWKLPQVCFHTESPFYPKLVLIHLGRLYQAKMLSYAWHIVLTDLSQTLGLTYSIQPNLHHTDEPHLGALQHDLLTIAKDMHLALKQIARDILTEHCR